MTLTRQTVEQFLNRVEAMTEDQLAAVAIISLRDRKFWLDIRQAQLADVAAIEKMLGITPTTADYRRMAKGKV